MCWQEDPEGRAVPREDMSKACALLLGTGCGGVGGVGREG